MRRIPRGALGAALSVVLALAFAACGGDGDDGGSTQTSASTTSGAAVTPAEVKAASKPWDCGSVFAVPRSAAGTKLAFINPGPADPYVAAWSVGMQDAAKFYGVDLKEGFMGNYDYAKAIDTYRSISAFDPDVVGAATDGPTGEALAAAVRADGSKVLLMDTIAEGVPQIGLENVEGGRIMGEELVKAVEPLLEGDWADRPIVVLGLTAEGCAPCDERVEGAWEVLRETLPESANVKYVRVVEKAATTDVMQRRVTDTITANPDANFVVAALDDGSGGGAFNAARQADIEDRMRIASIGGDNQGIENMRKGSPSYVASVDAKPYCEAWNWVEAAIAVDQGQPFDRYPYTGVVTPENADDYTWRLDIRF